VGDDAQPPLCGDGLAKGETAEDVEVVLSLGRLAPQGAAHQRVDAVGADQDVDLDDLAVGHVQADARIVVPKAVYAAVDLEDARRQGGEQPLVELGAQQADEPAAVAVHDLAGQVDPDAGVAGG